MGLGLLIDRDYDTQAYSDYNLEDIKERIVDILDWEKGEHYGISKSNLGSQTILFRKKGYTHLLHIIDSIGYHKTHYEYPPEINSYIYDRAESAVEWGLENDKDRGEVVNRVVEKIREDDKEVISMDEIINSLVEAESNHGQLEFMELSQSGLSEWEGE